MTQRKGNISFLPSTMATLLAGFLMTALCSWLLHRANDANISEAVDELAASTANSISDRVHLYQYGLRGARGVILTNGVDTISAHGFRRYSESRDIEKEFPGARGFGFIRKVLQGDEAAFLVRSRSQAGTDFQLTQLEPHEGDRLYIQFLEPRATNNMALGFDIASEPSRRQAAREAIDTGDLHITRPLTLIQDTSKPQQAFLLMMPVYQGPITPSTVDERRDQAVGLTFAPLVMADVLADLHIDPNILRVTLSDISDGEDKKVVFYDNHPLEVHATEIYSRKFERNIYGRDWRFELNATPIFIARFTRLPSIYVVAVGLLISFILAGLAGAVAISRAQRRAIMNARMELGAIVQSASDAIIGKDLQGIITSWNGGAQRLFGYTADEAVGRSILEMIVPNERAGEEQEMLVKIANGVSVENYNTVRLHKSGALMQVSITPSPVHNFNGVVVGASVAARDIASQNQRVESIQVQNEALQEQIQDSNATTQTILDTVVDSVISINEYGSILSFNPASTRIFEYTPEEIIGQHITRLIPQDRWPAYERFVARALEKSGTDMRSQEMEGLRKNGSVFPARVTVGLRSGTDTRVFVCVVSEITVEIKQRKELLAARDHLLLAAHAAELGVWTLNLREQTVSWNNRMFELYGKSSFGQNSSIRYEDWLHSIYPDDIPRVEQALEALVKRSEEFAITFRAVLPNGKIRYIQANALAEYDHVGVPLMVAGTHRDITLQHELENTLRQAKISADKANAAKSVLLSNMSHEIRTPLNAVLGMLQLLQRTTMDAQQRDYLASAYQATTSLLSLLNDILDYSKIEAGKLKLDNHSFEVQALFKDLAVIVAGNPRSQNVEVMFDIDLNVPLILVGDGLRIRQILVNLVSNALKFTIDGEIIIGLTVRRHMDGYVMLRLSVDDSGIGISAEQQERIFEGFGQAETSTSRRFGGTGLGLVISDRLVTLMGGKLSLESQAGKGSRFWFDVMLKVEDRNVVESQPKRLAARILLVDDNETSLELIWRMARSLGWELDRATSGQDAMEFIRRSQSLLSPYDVILLDYRMPDLDGVDTATLIINYFSGASVPPLVMLAAYEDQPTDSAFISSLFKATLNKPMTPWQLRDCLVGVMEGRPSLPRIAIPPLHPKLLVGVHVLVAEDNVVNRKVASGMLHHEGANVTLAMNGLEAVTALLENPKLFDAVLMDVQMPEMDGLEATRQIRIDPRFQQLPIIAMTANASIEEREACLAAGMDDHISKPVNLEMLVKCLKAWLEPSVVASENPRDDSEIVGLLDTWPAILARFGGDRDLLRDVLVIFASDSRKLLGQLHDLALNGDRGAARAIFHALKGSALNIGARSLAMRAAELEALTAQGDSGTLHALATGHLAKELSMILDATENRLELYLI